MTSLLTVQEFRHLTMLTEKDCLALIDSGELPLIVAEGNRLFIDISKMEPLRLEELKQKLGAALPAHEAELVEEAVAGEVLSMIEEILPAAAAMAARWRKA